MNIERVEQLIRVLNDVEKQRKLFDIGTWSFEGPCGTSGCAIGWAARDEWHQKQGLHLEQVADPHGTFLPTFLPVYDGLQRGEAVEAYLEMDEVQTQRLFYRTTYGSGHVTARQVAERLEKLLEIERAKLPVPELEEV